MRPYGEPAAVLIRYHPRYREGDALEVPLDLLALACCLRNWRADMKEAL